MKLDVVSEEVLPSERLKRLLRLGNFLGSCDETHKHTQRVFFLIYIVKTHRLICVMQEGERGADFLAWLLRLCAPAGPVDSGYR